MLLTLLWVNTLVSFWYIGWAIVHAKRYGSVVTAFLTSVYVATNGAFLWANQDAAANFGYVVTDAGLIKAAWANFVFIFVSFGITWTISFFQVEAYKKSENAKILNKREIFFNEKLLNLLFVLYLIVELRYLLLGGGMLRLSSLDQVQGRDSLYNLRYDESLAIVDGSGLFSALLGMRIIFPILAIGFFYKIIVLGDKRYYINLVVSILINLGMALSTLQRSPTFNLALVVALSFGVALSTRKHLLYGWKPVIGLKDIVLMVPILFVGSGIYAFTEQIDIFDGLYHIFERIFLISSFSSTSYYDLFGPGNSLPFAGWQQIIGYPVESNGADITYRDVGAAANGWAHNLNASFVATAYGAAGWSGLTVVAIFLVLVSRLVDNCVNGAWPLGWMALITVNIYVAFEVSNGPLTNGVFGGLGLNAILLYYIFCAKPIKCNL